MFFIKGWKPLLWWKLVFRKTYKTFDLEENIVTETRFKIMNKIIYMWDSKTYEYEKD